MLSERPLGLSISNIRAVCPGVASARVLIKDPAPAEKAAKNTVPSKLGFGVHK